MEKKILIFCLLLFICGFVLTFFPIETFSGKVSGISGVYYNDRAYFNTLFVTKEDRTKKAGTLFAGWESWDEAQEFYADKEVTIYKNPLGRWYLVRAR